MMLVDRATQRPLGPVVEFYELPQGLLLEFRTADGLASLPFVDEFVHEVDRDGKRIEVTLPDGLLT
jgi:ribosomal 30S subunit maturation factor RimM